jgi:biotin transport system substrate-specific component
MLQHLSFPSLTRNKDMVQTLMGIALMCVCSQACIPIQPVPITLQTLGVLLIGLTYTPRQAAYSVGGWIFLGAMGFPVFAEFSGGLHILLGLDGGYIWGFFLAIVAMSNLPLKLSAKTWWALTFNALMGSIILYGCGIAQLAYFIGWAQAWQWGFVPFIVPGILKALFLSGAIYGINFYRTK